VTEAQRRQAGNLAGPHRYQEAVAPLSPAVKVHIGDYNDLADAQLVILTAGLNEKGGGATDRSDPQGRLRLLDTNAEVYREIVPQVVKIAPQAVLILPAV
jgi:L-lactate dehydrogenase